MILKQEPIFLIKLEWLMERILQDGLGVQEEVRVLGKMLEVYGLLLQIHQRLTDQMPQV